MSDTVKKIPRRELAHRVSGGLEITLYWRPHDDVVSIAVYQLATEETISFRVPSDRALDAFQHPFVYLPDRGSDFGESIGRNKVKSDSGR